MTGSGRMQQYVPLLRFLAGTWNMFPVCASLCGLGPLGAAGVVGPDGAECGLGTQEQLWERQWH
jgi:hypothetical protein